MTTDADHIRAAIHAFDCDDLSHFSDDMQRVTVDALLAKQGKSGSRSFNAWWDSDAKSNDNPFRPTSPAFWAYEGWLACERASQAQEPT